MPAMASQWPPSCGDAPASRCSHRSHTLWKEDRSWISRFLLPKADEKTSVHNVNQFARGNSLTSVDSSSNGYKIKEKSSIGHTIQLRSGNIEWVTVTHVPMNNKGQPSSRGTKPGVPMMC